MDSHLPPVLELRAGQIAEGDLHVLSARGQEGISEPYRFEVDFERADGAPIELSPLLAESGLLTVRRPDGTEKLVNGVVEEAALVGVQAGRPRYRLRLVPRLALLANSQNSRIFQSLSVPEIAKAVLDEEKVDVSLSLSASYAKREYCVQYQESNLDFVSRLLEQEGIFYFFTHTSDGHVMKLVDAPSAFQDVEGEAQVQFREPTRAGQVVDEEHVFAFAQRASVRSGKVTLEDYDFEKPAVDLLATAAASEDEQFERYRYALGAGDPGVLKRLAKTRLEEVRVPVKLFDGQANCVRLAPGLSFELSDHPESDFNGQLQLLRVEHEAEAGITTALRYRCRFVAQPRGTAFRPRRQRPAPGSPGTQTATVVGPAGEEIYVDADGRIKVQFHWDRTGKKDERSSCFVRVAQSWAGPAWGELFIPRLGQEVLVRFLDGNPDQPVVVGAVYNGANLPPVSLPGSRTQSLVRSDSSPGGRGSNELRFEDAKGAEDVFFHAQKDENIVVEVDKRQELYGQEILDVAKDRSRTVGENQTLAVGGSDSSAISGDQTLTVAGARSSHTTLAHSEQVGGSQSITVANESTVQVGADSAVTVGAAAALTVGGAYLVTVGGVLNVAVAGVRLEQVGGARVTVVGAASELQVSNASSATVGGEEQLAVAGQLQSAVAKDQEDQVGGKAQVTAGDAAAVLGKSLQLEAQSKLSIKVGGKVLLEAQSSGQVELSGATITFDGSQIVTKASTAKKTTGSSASSSASQAGSDDQEKKASATATWGTGQAEPGADVTLNVQLTNVPDGKKGLITIHHAASGAMVPAGKLECESKGGKLVDKNGKAPAFQFTTKQLPWDPYDLPFFFFKASVQHQALSLETPADTADGGKSLRVKYFHVCLGDSWADAGGLTTGAEAKEIAGILGGVPNSKAESRMMSMPSPTFVAWSKDLANTYCYHHGSHGTCQDRVSRTFINVEPPPDGLGNPPDCPVGNWRSVVLLSKQAPGQYVVLGDEELRNEKYFPSVPRYLAYLDCCLAGWEPSLGRAFVGRGTQYVIAFRRTVPDGDAREMARQFHKKWAQTYKLDPDKIRDVFFDVGAPFYKTMRPVLISWRVEPLLSPDAGAVERALQAVSSAVEGVMNSIGSLLK